MFVLVGFFFDILLLFTYDHDNVGFFLAAEMLCTVNWEAGSASRPARASRNPPSQTQHCYPESGERLLHRVAFLHHQPLRRQSMDILIFTPGSPGGPLPGNGSGTLNLLPYKIYTPGKRKRHPLRRRTRPRHTRILHL